MDEKVEEIRGKHETIHMVPLLSFPRNPTVRSIIFSCFSETSPHNSELAYEFILFGTPTGVEFTF